MTLNEYQEQALKTAIYPGQGSIMGLVYTALGLGEAGEFQGGVKKILRDDNGVITEDKKLKLVKELGDQAWYLAACARELGYTLEEVAQINLHKLQQRQVNNTLKGSGDHR